MWPRCANLNITLHGTDVDSIGINVNGSSSSLARSPPKFVIEENEKCQRFVSK